MSSQPQAWALESQPGFGRARDDRPALTVLLAEDDPGDARLLREQLAEFGAGEFSVQWVEWLEDVLTRLDVGGLDVVLLDLTLPDSEACDTFERVRTLAPEVPVVVLTELADETLAIRAVTVGAQDYLVKRQVDGRSLVRCLRYAVERKRAEDALRESEARYRDLVKTSQDLIWRCDREGRLTYLNPAWERTHGYELEEMLGRAFADFQDPEVAARDIEEFGRHLAGGSLHGYETTHLSRNGEPIHLVFNAVPLRDATGDIVGTQGTARDITERKEGERRQVLLATAIEQAAESVVITGTDGTIAYVNPAFERITGYTYDEAIGRNPSMLKSGRHDKAFYQALWETILRGEVWEGRIINKKKDGSLYEDEGSISPVRDEHGDIVLFVAVTRDVTNEVRLERQLRQAQKMEALGTLAGGVAHDFNNFLVAIVGHGELAQESLSEGSAARGNVEQILSAADRGRSLINQILTFSRPGDGERGLVDLPSIVREALSLVSATLPNAIEIREYLDLHTATILADEAQVYHILMNLTTNASHAMQEGGGVLEVRVDEVTLDEKLASRISGIGEGQYVRLTVRDTGHGMDAATLERIFDPFFTTKAAGEGAGLGLSTVHGIVRSHQGGVSVESTPGKGTTFQIYFPRSVQPGPAALVPGPSVGSGASC